jgi:hypothetical protein
MPSKPRMRLSLTVHELPLDRVRVKVVLNEDHQGLPVDTLIGYADTTPATLPLDREELVALALAALADMTYCR